MTADSPSQSHPESERISSGAMAQVYKHRRRSHRQRRKKLLIAIAQGVGFIAFVCLLLFIWYSMVHQ